VRPERLCKSLYRPERLPPVFVGFANLGAVFSFCSRTGCVSCVKLVFHDRLWRSRFACFDSIAIFPYFGGCFLLAGFFVCVKVNFIFTIVLKQGTISSLHISHFAFIQMLILSLLSGFMSVLYTLTQRKSQGEGKMFLE